MKRPRGTIARRLVALMQMLLETPGQPLDYYARLLGVCPRTIRRDLDALTALQPHEMPADWVTALQVRAVEREGRL